MNNINGLSPIHPGEFLKEMLEEISMTQRAFAKAVGLSPMRISHVIRETRPITAELALIFGRAFGQTPQYWLNLQADYDLKKSHVDLTKVPELLHAA